MKRKIKYCILTFGYWLFANCFFVIAQTYTITPTLIGSTGNFSSASFGSISSSVGEPMVATTPVAGGVQLTQGFQQPTTKAILSLSVAVSASPATICAGSSTTLTASIIPSPANPPYTYNWSSGTSCPSCSNPVATPTSTGITIYTVTVTDNEPTTVTATVAVTVSPKPAVSISSTYTSICTGVLNSTTLTASSSGATSYVWSPGSSLTTQAIVVAAPNSTSSTTYTVVVTNAAGCKGKDTIHINVVSNPYTPLSVTPNPAVYCLGDSILPEKPVGNITGTVFWSDASGQLSFGTIYQLPQNLAVGTHTYGVAQGAIPISNHECFGPPTPFTVTINPTPTVVACPDITICPSFTAQLTSTVSGDTTGLWYQWFRNSWDTLIPNSNSPTLSVNPPRDSIMYIVDALNTYGCWHKDTVTIFWGSGADCDIHIYNGITPNGDGKNDEWWIDGISSFPKNNVSIFNRWGDNVWVGKNYDNVKIVWQGNDSSGQKLPSGTYYYVIELLSAHGNRRISKWVELTR